MDAAAIEHKIGLFKQMGIEYIRLECNFGSHDEIGGPAQLADNLLFSARFDRLAEIARMCQRQEMAPLALLQVPWRELGGDSQSYFEYVMASFAKAANKANVDPKRLFLESRPPMGLSAQGETGLKAAARESLGLQTGHRMFEVLNGAFDGEAIAGFCVAGGSTKGAFPTAMEDDTQNAVRQGFRQSASAHWGYPGCFWEMGAKLMLQPEVGQRWGRSQAERNAAQELFGLNAKYLADEIAAPL